MKKNEMKKMKKSKATSKSRLSSVMKYNWKSGSTYLVLTKWLLIDQDFLYVKSFSE